MESIEAVYSDEAMQTGKGGYYFLLKFQKVISRSATQFWRNMPGSTFLARGCIEET